MWFFRSPQIIYGEDALSFLSTLPVKRAAIITDRFLLNTSLPGKVRDALPESTESIVVGKVSEEPDEEQMVAGISAIRDFSPDWMIGLGGGSSMDTAKVLFAMYERPDISVYDITPLVPLNLRKKCRLIEIPTTSGTGSECSWAALLSEKNEKRKNELASPEILPDYAILDPGMVLGLPAEQTRNTAVDAITHAVESYVSQWNNPYSDALSEKALSLIIGSLSEVLNDPTNLARRSNVHIGASMAGLSFSNSQIGLAHALGHSLGAHFKIAHGKTVGLFLPYVVEYNYPSSEEKYGKLNSIFGEKYRGKRLQDSLRSYFRSIGQPLTLRDAGISRNEFTESLDSLVSMASESTGVTMNPRDAGSDEIRKLFMDAYGGL
ncbi:MAG: alcohol dehydrogenase [Thermoplasmatales archaeon B_DKE]|nr:MAG: alcohol dehydrogenase [Thermoplasmatales archaeon B_DKE]